MPEAELEVPISDAYELADAAKSRSRQDSPYGSQRNHSFLIVRFAVTLFPRAAPYLLLLL